MASTKTPLVHWVVCDDRVAGPYTHDAARRNLVRVSEVTRGGCGYEHSVVTCGFRPSTVAEIRPLREEWDDVTITEAHRGELTVELADEILHAPVGTDVGDLIVSQAGWSAETASQADAKAEPGTPAWYVALGAHEDALLTGDGEDAVTTGWCQDSDDHAGEVQYERWTAKGRVAHGTVCGTCRRLTQTG